MKIQKIAIILLLPILVMACSKSQKISNKLEGQWLMKSYINEYPGLPDIDLMSGLISPGIYTFSSCDFETEPPCSCTFQTTDIQGNIYTIDYLYLITNQGQNLNLIPTASGNNEGITWTIEEFKRKSLTLTRSDTLGQTFTLILENI